jgi:hypothetical protein
MKRIAQASALLATLAAVNAWAQTQSWDYKSYLKDPISGQYTKERFVTSTVTLVEKDGAATFRMLVSGRGDPCISRTELPAVVERDAEFLTITVTPPINGCEPFRYVIRNDGSGGTRLNHRGDRWVPDGFDHGLTPKK